MRLQGGGGNVTTRLDYLVWAKACVYRDVLHGSAAVGEKQWARAGIPITPRELCRGLAWCDLRGPLENLLLKQGCLGRAWTSRDLRCGVAGTLMCVMGCVVFGEMVHKLAKERHHGGLQAIAKAETFQTRRVSTIR